MIIPMVQVEVLGRRDRLDAVLTALQRGRLAEVVATPAADGTSAAETPAALEIVDAVLEHAPPVEPGSAPSGSHHEATVTDNARTLLPELRALDAADQALTAEADTLAHQVEVLAALESLVPDLAALSDSELAVLRLATVAVVLDDPDGRVVSLLSSQLDELLGDRYLMVTTVGLQMQLPTERNTVGCLLVLPRSAVDQVESLLGADRISHADLPQAFADRSLHSTLTAMRERLAALPAEHTALRDRRRTLLEPHLPALRWLRSLIRGRVERAHARSAAVQTARTFSLRLWVPRARFDELVDLLAPTESVVTVVRRGDVIGDPPVLLHTRRSWGPYQRLVSFLSWPSPAGIDPSGLMAIALPFLFGVMVGDVVYGVVLMAIGWYLRRRWPTHPVAADAGRILLTGGAWATVWGFLFGEALGNLGNTLGMPALWFYRGGPAALQPLLLFALALGAAHIILGLLLGLWSAARNRQLGRFADRGGTLLVLIGLFALTGVLAGFLPSGLLTPAVIGVIIGVVVASVSHGALGLLLGPLELLGALGNVLSYLRVAAVGLASVYLANVANELGANAPLLLGIVVATFLHVLNLALAAFSPTVQALRLHYVEFFSKFYDGGGRPFTPLGADLEVLPEAPDVPTDSPSVPSPTNRVLTDAAL